VPKQKSRSARWFEAVSLCQGYMETLRQVADDLSGALSDLRDIQSEYEDWQSNLPENLQGSVLGEKLQAVLDIEFPENPLDDWSSLEEGLEAAESAELPQGFGRD